jgi:predicted ABC-type ATPase
VIAGANGSGKSTLTKWARDFFQLDANLDADAASVDLQARETGEVGPIEAGREDLLVKKVSFSVETTLSGNTYLRMMSDARRRGYHTRVIYIGTEDLSINIARVKDRVIKGGHDVAIEDQRRRYSRSFRNLPRALALADEAVLLDNSLEEGHRVVGVMREGQAMCFIEPSPSWVAPLRF